MARDPALPPLSGAVGGHKPSAATGGAHVLRRAEGSETMRAWERFLAGDSHSAALTSHQVVASWQRSLEMGVNPTSRTAPLVVRNDGLQHLRDRHSDLTAAAGSIFAEITHLFAGSQSIMLLTNPDGVVLEAVGDLQTLERGQDIHLMQGGDWRECVVGTNGIGTAIATGRPAHVHATEHFCEGIKHWTCAAAPIYEPGTGTLLGVVDISGPPSTYQRNNLALAVTAARQIESVLGERAAQERAQLLEACLSRLSASDAAGLIAIDRSGRLVHSTGRVPMPVRLGERLPGLDANLAMDAWPQRLPEGCRPEWFTPISSGGRMIGAVLVVPPAGRVGSGRPPAQTVASEADPERSSFAHITGRSAAMGVVLARAARLAAHRVPVLIEGETGVGKELLARAIHGGAEAGRRPFIAFNCGAVSRELVAGELFGHVRGAFTGATSDGRPGRFELAHQGTLCLDEIGEMPLDLQPVLLRVLEEGVVYRLGDTQPRRVDVRLVAITNRNLRHEVEAGRFRRDLFHRISVTSLVVPPLRDRPEDIDVLVEHFNRRLAARHQVPMRRFGPGVIETLRALPWQGNVRELRNVIENLLLTGENTLVTLADLPAEIFHEETPRIHAVGPKPLQPTSLEEVERSAILQALRQAKGNMAGAARQLEISRSTLYRKIVDYRLRVPHHDSDAQPEA